MAPVLFCSENCGAGDFVSQYYVITVPIYSQPFQNYVNGILYRYTEREGTRCRWDRVVPGTHPWDIQKFSRYPAGWAFPEVEPVPGVWTYRLSIDDVLPVPLIHGWSASHPRYVPPAVDPLHGCTSAAALQNYVPLTTRPDALATPINTLPPPLGFSRHTTPCFCSGECPPGSRPTYNYLVRSTFITSDPAYTLGKLYTIFTGGPNPCHWKPHTPVVGNYFEDLTKTNIFPINADHAYEWQWDHQTITGPHKTFRIVRQWNDTDNPIEYHDGLCDVPTKLTEYALGEWAEIIPVPWWLCSDAEAQAWVAAHS